MCYQQFSSSVQAQEKRKHRYPQKPVRECVQWHYSNVPEHENHPEFYPANGVPIQRNSVRPQKGLRFWLMLQREWTLRTSRYRTTASSWKGLKKTKGERGPADFKHHGATGLRAVDPNRGAGKQMEQQKAEKQILTHMDIIYDESDTTEHGKRTAFSKIVLSSGWMSVASFTATPKALGW